MRAARWLAEHPGDAIVYFVTIVECAYALTVIVAVLLTAPRF